MMKLLIADDERIIRQTIAEHIDWTSMGVEVIGTACDGVEAYDMILDEYPDIVMTDIKMPGLSGLELISKIKKVNEDVEFIILSGYAEFEFAREAMQAGIKHYLLKPCSEVQIMDSVKSVMEDIANKRAARATVRQDVRNAQLDDIMILNIINEGVSRNQDAFSEVYSPYQKFIDFQNTPYELCCLFYTDERVKKDFLTDISRYRERFAPGVPFYILYVYQTLMVFFPSFHYQYQELDSYMNGLQSGNTEVSHVYQRTSYTNLTELLDRVICSIRRYDTIYYAMDGEFVSVCNYRNLIHSVETCTLKIFQEGNDQEFQILSELLGQVSDAPFLKQLASSIVMLFASKLPSFTTLDATELLLTVNAHSDCDTIRATLLNQLGEALKERLSGAPGGTISARVKEYVQEHYSDPDLSLKWISENVLYMNVDYVSKRFFKETGEKFSRYLSALRVQKAKEMLSMSSFDKIQSIAESVGCGNNPQYFSQLFKKATGVTPSNYIKFIQGGKHDD
ncbi:MAG: response regulator [Lachnospiraceae bacterium]|nr:response regulator [Lachnospiraceae bacterium]